MKKYKRFICIIMIVVLIGNMFIFDVKKASAVPVVVPIAKIAWDVVGTLLVVMAGYQLNEIVTGKDSPDALTEQKIDNWVTSGQMTSERKAFAKEHFGRGDRVLKESVARDFVGNLTDSEFSELKELTNPNRDPKIYKFPDFKGISNALNLSIFAKIYEYFRNQIKQRYQDKGEENGPDIVEYVAKLYLTNHYIGSNQYKALEFSVEYNYAKKMGYNIHPALFMGYSPVHESDIFISNMGTSGTGMQGYFYQNLDKTGSMWGYSASPLALEKFELTYAKVPVFTDWISYQAYISGGSSALPSTEWKPKQGITYDNLYNKQKTEIPEDGGQDLTTYINNYYYNTYEGDITNVVGDRSVQDATVNPVEPSTDYTGLFGDVIQALVNIKNAIIALPEAFITLLNNIYNGILSIPTHIDNFFNWVKTSWNDLIDTINDIPDAISTGINNIVQDLFVPDSLAIQELVEHMDSKIKNQTGILTYPLSLVILFLNNVANLGVNDCILVMPQLKLNGYVLSERYEFNFTQFVKRSEFLSIYQLFRTITNFIMILGVLTLAIKKGDQIIRGT